MARRTSGSKSNKAPTGGKPWTTPRQYAWLMNMRDLHREAQESGKRGAIKAFLRQVLDEFVTEFWKDQVMNDEERSSQLKLLNKACGSEPSDLSL